MSSEEKNDEQILIRLPAALKAQIESASKVDGLTSQEWIRKSVRNRIGLMNVCSECGKVNPQDAKFCNECGGSLKDSKKSLFIDWLKTTIIQRDDMTSDEVIDMLIEALKNSD